MYKVLIADDERRIVSLIESLIDWERIGLELIGFANDGETAYNMIKQYAPDIVLTDVRMPMLDGIGLIKRVSSEKLPCKFIIFSGHKQFDYVHDAIRYNAVDFLLKPINREELNTTLEKICNVLSIQRAEASELSSLKKRIFDDRSRLKGMFITDCMNGRLPKSLEECQQKYGNTFNMSHYGFFFGWLDDRAAADQTYVYGQVFEKILSAWEELFSEQEIMTAYDRNYIATIINFEQKGGHDFRHLAKSAFDQMQRIIGVFSGLSITMGACESENGYEGLVIAAQNAKNAASCRVLLGRNRIIYSSDLSFKAVTLEDLFTKQARQDLYHAFEILDCGAYEQWLHNLLSTFSSDVPPFLLFDICEQICNTFDEIVGLVMPDVKFENGPLRPEMIHELSLATNMRQIFHALLSPVVIRLNHLLEQKRIIGNAPIREAKRYIAEHYMEQIKLEDIAQKVFLHPAYLSSVFKRSTGMNFKDYLANYRIEKAKELLVTTNDRINEIALKVGYLEPHSFSKRFLIQVGIKPTEYRKLHS